MNEITDKILSMNKSIYHNIDYINYINELQKNNNYNIVIKKYYADSDSVDMDISSNKYNYKIYVNFVDDGKYLLEIRKKLSEIYKEYGIHWEIYYSIENNRIVTIEEREELDVCNEKDITCDELLLNWKNTLDYLSDKLRLANILEQIRNKITTYKKLEVDNLIILRDKLVNASDYAITSNNKIILLEDDNFSLFLTNYKGEMITFRGLLVDVNTTCGEMTFSFKKSTSFNDKVQSLYKTQTNFFIYDYSCKEKYLTDSIKYFDDAFQSQIDIFTGSTGVEKIKYANDYTLDYFNKLKHDEKYIIEKNKMRKVSFNREDGKRIS